MRLSYFENTESVFSVLGLLKYKRFSVFIRSLYAKNTDMCLKTSEYGRIIKISSET